MTREESIGNLIHAIRWNDMPKKEALDIAIKALEQEPCDVSDTNVGKIDAISRQAVWDVMQELWGTSGELLDRLMALPSVTPKQVPCGDAISRQAVIDSLHSKFVDGFDSDRWWNSISVLDTINKVPSVKPQEPKPGHWEWVQYDYNPKLGNWQCSECRCVVIECVDKNEKGCIPLYKYCPQCGIKIIETQESENEE